MRRALVGCLAVSAAAPVLGLFLMLRRMSLTADVLGHGILPGVAAGFLLAGLSVPVSGGSSRYSARIMSAVPSSEPSSTTMMSSGGALCANSAAKVAGSTAASLYDAMTAVTATRSSTGTGSPAAGRAFARGEACHATKASSSVS